MRLTFVALLLTTVVASTFVAAAGAEASWLRKAMAGQQQAPKAPSKAQPPKQKKQLPKKQ